MAERRVGKTGKPSRLPKLPAPKVTGRTHLVIGDAHCQADVPNQRFEWLGKFVAELKPDVVVDIGDWWDMPSLNTFDRPGSKSFEGRRYWLDIEAGVDAQERFQWALNKRNKELKQKCKPRLVRTLGNHEYRIQRALEQTPRFEGMIGLHDLMSAEFGWEEVPFREDVLVEKQFSKFYDLRQKSEILFQTFF